MATDSLTCGRSTVPVGPATQPVSQPTTEKPANEAPVDEDARNRAAVDEDNNDWAVLVAVVLPFAGLIAAIVLSWGWGVNLTALGIMLGMYLFSGLGITVGFHRYFTHRSFETVRPIQYLLAIAGSTAMQGSMLRWVAIHRRHHQHSDEENDPHSPHMFGTSFWAVMRGWFHAHMGWMWVHDGVPMARYVTDLLKDKTMTRVSNAFPWWVLIGILVPTAAGWLLTGTLWGALLGFVWGGLVRLFLVQHVTWSINSVCHIWGARPYVSKDESRNNPIFGILAFGEGWHNNHHAFPTSARHGLAWWQIDTSYMLIRTLELLGLAWKVRLPRPTALANKRVH